MSRNRVVVGITTDFAEWNGVERLMSATAYARAVTEAGGVPVLLRPDAALVDAYAELCDAFVLTGGDDPRTEPFGEPTDHRVTLVRPERQAFESSLLESLNASRPQTPVLGICLGMQMMALHAGGRLDQYMPDSTPTARDHWESSHALVSSSKELVSGTVLSKHKQAIVDPGRMRVIASAPDGVIEAISDPERPFYLGVQWHPERTADRGLGQELFERLVRAGSRGS